jgi:adenylate cyclase
MERSQEILDLYQRYARGDLRGTPADQIISNTPAVSLLGTDPTEWSTDRAQIVQAADAQSHASQASGMQTIPTDPQAWSEGDVGWVVDQPRVRLPNGAEVQMRVTAIVHRENGTWKIVHQHASIGVPNDQVEAFRGQ